MDHMVFVDLGQESLVDVRWTQSRMSKGMEETQLLLEMMLTVKRIGGKSPSLLSLSSKCLRLAEPSRRPGDQGPGKAGFGVSPLWWEAVQGRVGNEWRTSRGMRGVERAPIAKEAPLLHPVDIFHIRLLAFSTFPLLNSCPSSGIQLHIYCFQIKLVFQIKAFHWMLYSPTTIATQKHTMATRLRIEFKLLCMILRVLFFITQADHLIPCKHTPYHSDLFPM